MADDDVPVAVPSASAVSIKLPPFWAAKPQTWFVQAEAQFHIRGIVSEVTKFYYVVSALSQDDTTSVQDLLHHVPETNPYSIIKERLISQFSLDKYQRAEALLGLPALGDRLPSMLLADMKALLPPGMVVKQENENSSDWIFSYLFLSRLPLEIRSQLSQFKEPLDQLAKRADVMFTCRKANSDHVRHVQDQGDAAAAAAEQDFLAAQVQHRPMGKDRPVSNANPGLCAIHRKYGKDAFRCRKPCSWTGNDKTSSRA